MLRDTWCLVKSNLAVFKGSVLHTGNTKGVVDRNAKLFLYQAFAGIIGIIVYLLRIGFCLAQTRAA